ncbi:hypothetical protein J6590_015190 [Homalodisca vitripennis]|nr:hypothetical protein J6590_015190 [Homalodisca vitripennis]
MVTNCDLFTIAILSRSAELIRDHSLSVSPEFAASNTAIGWRWRAGDQQVFKREVGQAERRAGVGQVPGTRERGRWQSGSWWVGRWPAGLSIPSGYLPSIVFPSSVTSTVVACIPSFGGYLHLYLGVTHPI